MYARPRSFQNKPWSQVGAGPEFCKPDSNHEAVFSRVSSQCVVVSDLITKRSADVPAWEPGRSSYDKNVNYWELTGSFKKEASNERCPMITWLQLTACNTDCGRVEASTLVKNLWVLLMAMNANIAFRDTHATFSWLLLRKISGTLNFREVVKR